LYVRQPIEPFGKPINWRDRSVQEVSGLRHSWQIHSSHVCKHATTNLRGKQTEQEMYKGYIYTFAKWHLFAH
jgi:hypothetical protein